MPRLPSNWQDIAAERINAKIPHAGDCPVCKGEGTRRVEDAVVSPTAKNGRKTPWYPQAALTCLECGYTTYHNLVVLGVFDEQGNGREQ